MENFQPVAKEQISPTIVPEYKRSTVAMQSHTDLPIGMIAYLSTSIASISRLVLILIGIAMIPAFIAYKIDEFGEKLFPKNWSAFHSKAKD